jgi:hypothetical protein
MGTNVENYRSCIEYKEILRILQKSSFLPENIIWQNIGGKRVIIPIENLEIDFMARDLVVSSGEDLTHLSSEYPLYVKLDYHSTVFKVLNYQVSPHLITFEIPKEMKTPELRTDSRSAISNAGQKTIMISPFLNEKTSKGEELKIQLVDVSINGLGLLISEKNKSYIRNHRVFWLHSMDDQILEYPLLAEVVYISSEYFSLKDKTFKFGMKLSKPLPKPLFEKLTKSLTLH